MISAQHRRKNRVGARPVQWHTAFMNDYERIAGVIRYLEANHVDQPDLETLAQQAELSPAHFHRLFSAWAGVTPKNFLQCLTLSRLKTNLAGGESVLDASLHAGLSGPGRAHDLCIRLEAASAGELKSAGAGWTINAGFARSPFGICLIAEGPRGICHLSFVDEAKSIAWEKLRSSWRHARFRRSDSLAAARAEQIFSPSAREKTPPLRAWVRGTEFQVRVWRALIEIPQGKLTSYGRIAEKIERPAAVRAVGSAVGANDLAVLIPCHRVIRESGLIGDYRWGHVRKCALIARETAGGLCSSPGMPPRLPPRHRERPMAF
jgi:AraC family transcriptional regulator of adaptative response/methylated-DNA-[protein]-cysteine methyltransferase